MLKLNFIYSKTYNFVYLRAKSILKKEEDILQLMKEVYLHAVAHVEELNEDNLYEWLGKQTYILGCSKYRRKKVREAKYIALGKQYYEAQEGVEREITKEVIREALEELPDMYQATLYAFYYDQMKLKEIAMVMGYNKKAMVNRINYTHKYLDQALKNFVEEQEEEIDAQFSVELTAEALREWSALNRMSVDAAQKLYVGICKELGEQSEGIEFRENELAGANNRIAGDDVDGLNAICQELEAYEEKPPVDKKWIGIAGAVVAAVVVIGLVVVFFPELNKLVDKVKEEQQWVGAETDNDIDADTENSVNTEEAEDTEEETVDEDEAVNEEETTQPPAVQEPEYILPNSNTTKLTRSDLSGLSKEQLRLARNEIFARYGMIFGAEDLKNYFGSKSWYQPSVPYAEFQDKVEMNLIEEANLNLILKVEEEMQ